MKRIKAFFYNNQVNYIIAVLVSLAILPFTEKKPMTTLLIVIIILTYYFTNMAVNSRKSKNLKYFHYGYILFYKRFVWINQHVKRKRDMNKCPQKEFVRELSIMLKEIPEGTLCYCCTHELIKEHIIKKYPEAIVSEAYIKDLKWLKRKLKTKKCKQCTAEKCTLLISDKTQFYSIKFLKCNANHQ